MSTPRASYDAFSPTGKPGAATSRAAVWYPLGWRILAAVLLATSGAAMPALLGLALGASDPPLTPLALIELFAIAVLLPAAAARLVRIALSGQVGSQALDLQVSRPGLALELPWDEIAGVLPWRVPLPGPGLSLCLRAGGRLRLALADPAALLRVLAAAGVADAARAASHPTLVWAEARAAHARGLAAQPALKFALFGLLPASVLFYTHQHIAYGGLLGEYHLLGPAAYLRTFTSYWAGTGVYLVLYASLWRGLAECLAWLAAWLAPARAAPVRKLGELGCLLAYYGGVPVLLALRYFA